MMKYCKMTVEQFGKIRKAEIELAPLTLFVGDNNSGKNYLLSLSWAMCTMVNELVFSANIFKNLKSRSYNVLKAILLENIDNLTEEHSEFIDILMIKTYLQDV